ncbi:hypothetical protein A2V71_00745 [Candidatus Berkelbacteria bacterium RBG_13_40_8]|uniref:Uncharacterized protein n=1 Tax=Candidatus Berkelbacteria bacterium RBG_13_40_8 TaxID=1797467 RepID=A0A1F5DQC6_9BACT|nr:MAG: hypothetical protein A2V71_00745 [Candidatus Berkelbacteria bacterium RBG_13_40_8]
MEKEFWNPLSFITLMSALVYLGWYFYKYSKSETLTSNYWLRTLSSSASISFLMFGSWGILVLAFYYLF